MYYIIDDCLTTGTNGTDSGTAPVTAPAAKRRSTASGNPRGAKRNKATPSTIASADGLQLAVEKKARKARSDKGKARGPRKKASAASTSSVPT
jgi:hypothetical protein